MRTATIQRKTGETDIRIALTIEGRGTGTIATKIPFFDHMLTLFARHSLVDLDVKADGDIEVDFHHTVEDTGIALGQAFAQALGGKKGSAATATRICRWTKRSPASSWISADAPISNTAPRAA